MKKTIGIVGGIALCLLTVSVNAQTEPQTPKPVNTWEAKKNPTVDSITSQYAGKYIAPRPALTSADIFPVIGKYESATNADAASVTIALDGQNKGIVWIEGLPQGKVKAMLRKSPAIYKIPSQKTEDGKEVAEGTLIFDKETNTLSICIGKPYNSDDPMAAFAIPAEEPEMKVKTKTAKTKIKVKESKAWTYTGTKLVTETVAN
jgi:hypothetical protein